MELDQCRNAWMYQADKACENSPAGPAEIMSPFKEALSAGLYRQYIVYFNSLGLPSPACGEPLLLSQDGRGAAPMTP